VFDIFLTCQLVEEPDRGFKAVYGQIQIGDFCETFVASLACWDQIQYAQHWASAVSRIMEGQERSALVTSFLEPSLSHHLVWWPMYRDRDVVYIQNQLLFFDQLAQPFSSKHLWDFVGERRQWSDDDQKISEWALPIQSMEAYLLRKKSKN
jgi:hypothetical protein